MKMFILKKNKMKLIKSNYEIIEQQPGLDGIYKAIESAGRTCYKSEDKITDNYFIDDKIVPPDTEVLRQDGYATVNEFVDKGIFEVNFNGTNIKMKKESSAKEFVDRMIKSGHHAMLEFGTVYLSFPLLEDWHPDNTDWGKYAHNKYSYLKEYDKPLGSDVYESRQLVTTNYRTLVEHGWLEDLKYLCEPTENHEKRICVRFTTDRGVSHELVRHRVFSFAQESTRYCNYSKDKFSNELTFIIPSWCTLGEGKYSWQGFNYGNEDYWCGWRKDSEPLNTEQSSDLGKTIIERMINYHALLRSLNSSEENYKELLSKHTPQEARQVLPNALKTEINMCGFTSDWEHFFALRDNSHAHPDMQSLVKPLHQEFINRKLLE